MLPNVTEADLFFYLQISHDLLRHVRVAERDLCWTATAAANRAIHVAFLQQQARADGGRVFVFLRVFGRDFFLLWRVTSGCSGPRNVNFCAPWGTQSTFSIESFNDGQRFWLVPHFELLLQPKRALVDGAALRGAEVRFILNAMTRARRQPILPPAPSVNSASTAAAGNKAAGASRSLAAFVRQDDALQHCYEAAMQNARSKRAQNGLVNAKESGDSEMQAVRRAALEDARRVADQNRAAAGQRALHALTRVEYPDHFLRPHYQQPDEPDQPIEFMITDMDITNARTNIWDVERRYEGDGVRPAFWHCYVRVFGVTAAGHSVCCYLSGWKPYIYVQVPPEWTSVQLVLWLDELDDQTSLKNFRKSLADACLTQRVTLYGYTRGTPITVARLAFHSAAAKRRACKFFGAERRGDNDYFHQYSHPQHKDFRFWLWDGAVSDRQQFVNNTGIAPSTWVRVADHCYTFAQDTRRAPHERRARTQIDIDAPYGVVRCLPERQDVAPLLVESWDTEVMREARDRRFPEAKAEGDEMFQIGTAVWRFGEPLERVPAFAAVHCVRQTDNVQPGRMHVNEFADERDMLAHYAVFTRDKVDADVRISFNGYGFDNERWEQRALMKFSNAEQANAAGGAPPLPYRHDPFQTQRGGLYEYGRVRGVLSACRAEKSGSKAHGDRESHLIDMAGRVQLDLLKWSAEEWKMPRSLNYVANDVFEQASKGNSSLRKDDFVKLDLPFWDIHDNYVRDAAARGRIADYCRVDTEVPLRIVAVKQVLLGVIEVSRLTGLTMDDVINRKQMVRTFAKLSKYAHDRNFMLPEFPERFVLDPHLRAMMFGGQKFQGATVVEPKRGFYDTPIATLDFAGLYPSIIRGYGLCYTTLITDPRWLSDPDTKWVKIEIANADPRQPPYVLYWCTNAKPLLYDMLTDILDARAAAKALKKKHADDPFLNALYDQRQLSLKLIANSVYGFTGATKNRYACLAISASVTWHGRRMIQETIAHVERAPEVAEVIYGDTDSVMIRFLRSLTLAQVFDVAKRLAREVSALFPKEIELEFEKVFLAYLLWMKKNYAGLKLEQLDGTPKYSAKGIASVRGDKIGLVKRLTDDIIKTLLYDKDVQKAIALLRADLDKLIEGRIDAAELVQEKKLTKALSEYPANTVHADVARAMTRRDPGTAPRAGEMVAYVVVRGPGKKVHAVDYAHYCAHRERYELDTLYYLQNLIVDSLGKLLDLDGLCNDPFRLFEPYVARARAANMRTASVARFARVDSALNDEAARATVLGNGQAMLTKTKLQHDRKRRLNHRQEEAKRLHVSAKTIGKGSIAAFLSPVVPSNESPTTNESS